MSFFKVQFRTNRQRLKIVFAAVICSLGFGCHGKNSGGKSALIVVNSPANGVVSRILTPEGTDVKETSVIVEITSQSGIKTEVNNNSGVVSSNNVRAISNDVLAAEKKLEQASVEVSRMESLVASNAAPQAQLDAARDEFQKAQGNLDKTRDQARRNALRITPRNQIVPADNEQKNELVSVKSPVSGTLKVLSVRQNQTIKQGEPLAVIASDEAQ